VVTFGQISVPHAAPDRFIDRSQILGRTELEELGSRLGSLQVPAGDVEGVARFVDLLVVVECIDDLALEHVAPVRARAAVVRQALEHGCRVDVDLEPVSAFSARSSPNHFACSCASVWHPTPISSAV
jgi:hypothetical protein